MKSKPTRRPRCRPTVEILEDRTVPATITVTDPGDTVDVDGKVTLREAITSVNAGADLNDDVGAAGAYGTADTILFNLPGTGVRTIDLTAGLPTLLRTVTIDGLSQPGAAAGALLVELNGAAAVGADGLAFSGVSNALVRGLVINRFDGAGVRIEGGSGNRVQGNFIGSDAAGAARRPNGVGVVIAAGSRDNLVGTDGDGSGDADEGNLLSGNRQEGLLLTDTSGNRVAGNRIGTNAAGTAELPNSGGDGVRLTGATNNVIGTDGDGSAGDAAEGNLISGNGASGVALGAGAMGNRVAGNTIGSNAAGDFPVGNFSAGVFISDGASNNIVGTNGDGSGDEVEGNLLSGNKSDGVQITGAGTTGNRVAGNLIGTNAAGTAAIADWTIGGDGVRIRDGASGNLVGTNGDGVSDTAERNVIGRRGAGVRIEGASGNVVAGNFIGTDVTGTVRISNSTGVRIESFRSQDNIIGTNGDGQGDEAEGNLISGNSGDGVYITDLASKNRVAGNRIGTDVTGTAALPNFDRGVVIWFAYDNIIGTNGDGSGDAAEGNLVSGNAGDGVLVFRGVASNRIAGNRIGTDVAGTALVPNGGNGVALVADTLGGVVGTNGDGIADEAEGNIIAGNGGHGVEIFGASSGFIRILHNSIFANGGLGIDLNDDGVTPNDLGDADTGPNVGANFPVLVSARGVGPNLVVEGFARPGAAIEFFIADADPSGFGEGRTYLLTRIEGSADDLDGTAGSYGPTVNGLNVGSDATNRFRFVIPLASLPVSITDGLALTATATILGVHTSEFSNTVAVVPESADLAVRQTVSDARPYVGDVVTFVIRLTNKGPADATTASVTDRLPAGLALVSAVAPAGTSYDPGTGVWTVGPLASGASVRLRIRARVVGTGPLTSTARARSDDQFDPVLANNVDSLRVVPLRSDLRLVQRIDQAGPVIMGTVTFTFVVSNNGPDAATGVVMRNVFPAGLVVQGAGAASQGRFDPATGVWAVGRLAPGARAVLRVSVGVGVSGPVQNTATVRGREFDPFLGNNLSTLALWAVALPGRSGSAGS